MVLWKIESISEATNLLLASTGMVSDCRQVVPATISAVACAAVKTGCHVAVLMDKLCQYLLSLQLMSLIYDLITTPKETQRPFAEVEKKTGSHKLEMNTKADSRGLSLEAPA